MPLSGHQPTAARVLALAGLALLAGAAAPASAARSVAVAPLGGLGIGESEALKVQRWIEAALAGLPGHRVLGGARLAKLLRQQSATARGRGCDADARCLGGLARTAGVDLVVAGEVGSMSGAFMVYLRLVGADGGAVRAVSGVLDPARSGLRDAARALAYQLILPARYAGTIAVQVDVPEAWIYVDGRRLARSPAAPLAGLSVGTHALRVTHERYRDFLRFVTVGFEQTLTVPVRLAAFPVRAEEMRLVDPNAEPQPLADSELPWYRRWWVVTTFGAVILGASTAVVTILARRSVSRDSEAVVRP